MDLMKKSLFLHAIRLLVRQNLTFPLLYKAMTGILVTVLLAGCVVVQDRETQPHHEAVANLQQPAEQTPPVEQIEKPQTLGVSIDDILALFRDLDVYFNMEELAPIQGQTHYWGSTDDELAYLGFTGNEADISEVTLSCDMPADDPEIRKRNAALCETLCKHMHPCWQDEYFDEYEWDSRRWKTMYGKNFLDVTINSEKFVIGAGNAHAPY